MCLSHLINYNYKVFACTSTTVQTEIKVLFESERDNIFYRIGSACEADYRHKKKKLKNV